MGNEKDMMMKVFKISSLMAGFCEANITSLFTCLNERDKRGSIMYEYDCT